MKKTKILLKTVAFFLAIMFVVQILPLSTLATEINNREILEDTVVDTAEEYSPEIVGEVESLRDEYTKHFRREDGSFVAAVYNEPVHYQKNGEWKEIDNTPKVNTSAVSEAFSFSTVNDAKYIVSETSTPVTFPNNIRTGEITILKDGNVISFGAKSEAADTLSTAVLSEPEELMSTAIAADFQTEEIAVQVEESNTELIADTHVGAISYENAFENASLEYEVSSSRVKESIVVSEKSDNYRYEFSIDFGEYMPLENEDGGIYIYESEQSQKPVMAILPPYMFDAENETSDAVTMELVQAGSEYTLIVEADANWINAFGRKFPVVIDPTFVLDVGRSNTNDIHVSSSSPNKCFKLDYQLEVGRNNESVFRTYIKYNLPILPDCSVVTNAELKLVQNWSRSFDNDNVYLNVYRCDSPWNFDSITWNNQPIQNLADATVVDYTNFIDGMSKKYYLNITKIVKNWYENGENYGLMLASSDESVEEKTSFYSSRNIVSNYPVFSISYVNNTGIEDYWTYEGFSLGESGCAYINTYNGALTYVHNDVSTSGLVAPLSISHVYNNDERSKSGAFNNMKFGKGFKLNIIEKIEAVNTDLLSDYPYKYIDADGTVHFFKKGVAANQYYYEFGSEIVLTSSSSGFVMTTSNGSRKVFNSSGYLTEATDKNGNTITVTYSNGKITRVTDGAGVSVDLSYNSDNTLSYISDAAGRRTFYHYNTSGYLTDITYPDGTKTLYEYDITSSLINKITSFDTSYAVLSYKAAGNAWKTSSFSIYGDDSTHVFKDTVSFVYRTSDTVISNTKGNTIVLAFDNTGKVINCIKDGKTISVSKYNGIGSNNNNSFNKPSFVSNEFTPTEDLSSRSYSHYYHVATDPNTYIYVNNSKERLLNGFGSTKLGVENGKSPSSSYVYSYTLPHNDYKTYTYSIDVNIEDTLSAGAVYLEVEVQNRNDEVLFTKRSVEITTTNNEWKRLCVTVTMPENTGEAILKCGVFDGVGVMYMGGFHYEEAEASNKFNMVMNSSFNNIYTRLPVIRWSADYHGNINYGVNPLNGSKALVLTGNPNMNSEIHQDITTCGKTGDVLVFGASAQALCSASGNNNGDSDRFFGMRIKLYNNDQLLQSDYIYFNKEALNTMQTIMGSIVANEDYNKIKISLCYNHEINSAIFDDVFLYCDAYGVYYDYYSDGRLKSVSDDNGQKINSVYSGPDLVSVTATSNDQITQTASYTYDSKHNLVSAEGSDGTITTYNYPATGNKGLPLSVTISDASGQNSATTSYTYYDNYNYLKSVTDPSGATTQYIYDNGGTINKGLITKVIDPNGNAREYTYDPNNDLLLSETIPSEELGNPQLEYEYDSAKRLAHVYRDREGFHFYYDSYGRLEIAETSTYYGLITNDYDERNNLTLQFYGSESWSTFTYDENDRLKTETYNGNLSFEHDYTSDGKLGRTVDKDNEVSWDYRYDIAGRLTNVFGSDGRSIYYDYNDKNQLGSFKVEDGNSTLLKTDYSYDSVGRASEIQVSSMSGTPSQEYSYDSLGRTSAVTTEYSGSDTVSYNYTYQTNGNNQTSRIDTISYVKTSGGVEENILPQVKYSYDANGNITHIYENNMLKIRYEYDGMNRLVREDNFYLDKTVTYCYNHLGDILSKTEYELSFLETPGALIETIEYEYDYSSRSGAVIEYGETETMLYNEVGNPLSYRGYSMVWQKNRELAAMSNTQQTLRFKYDSNGIRTLKRVNGVETEFTYVGGMLVSQKTGDEVINFAYTAGGAPYGFTYDGQNYFYLLSLQGDIIGIYDSTGTVVVRYTYDAWGKLISITGQLANTVGVKNPLRYRGYYYDTEIGLYYLQSRYYDPETCHFINRDSYFIAGNDHIQGANMFSYCYNNPVMYSDPTGYDVDGTTNNVIEDMTYYFFGILILKTLVYMSDEDIVYLVNEIEDSGDFYYVSTVIFNGYYFGILPMHEGIKGRKNFEVCRAFLNKNVCLKVAEYYAWAYEGDGNAITGIAQEIYGHAMLYYNFDSAKDVVDHILNTVGYGNINDHADPIDLGGNSKIYTFAFEMIWKYM